MTRRPAVTVCAPNVTVKGLRLAGYRIGRWSRLRSALRRWRLAS